MIVFREAQSSHRIDDWFVFRVGLSSDMVHAEGQFLPPAQSCRAPCNWEYGEHSYGKTTESHGTTGMDNLT